ncbi:MAG TPA: glycoside hydrolase family 3 N-terminal domain-containing protein, partial [Bacteroidales bacterium]|nr:glycoside hydrolase family 3 N-terminal domain-containing protein [Bacteroidales bacterium]
MKVRSLLVLLLLSLMVLKGRGQNYTYPYLDPSVDLDARVDDLLGKLTLEEKASLMLYNSPAIGRLGIPEYNWWSEALHGVARAGKATVFPQAIGLAATFDDDLVYRVADAISDEARAKHHEAVRRGIYAQNTGLSFWSPNINIFRDPRWGRGQETYGEDPCLTAMMGKAFVRGMQGDNPDLLKTAACAKHYVVHSGPEASRHYFNAIPDEIDFRETYLPAFRALVDAGVESVMCAYNRTYDDPCCGSRFLLYDILREEWGFKGHIVSDCWALDDIWARHKVMETRTQAAAMAARAGVNLNCGYIYKHLPEAVRLRMISEEEVDDILRPLLRSRFRLGLFDPEGDSEYSRIPVEIVNCDAHKSLAREAAVKSVVMLKNNGVLPLDRDKLKGIFVTGPIAADIAVLTGNYNGYSGEMVTMLEGIVEKAGPGIPLDYTTGVLLNNDSLFYGFWHTGFAEVIIAVMGNNRLLEGEEGDAMLNLKGGDRQFIEFPENQLQFLRELRKRIGDKKLVVVVTGGSAIAMPEVEQIADALLFAWYPGEQGGNAVADIIFGDANPSGRLPVTFYKSTKDLPPFDDYNMAGRTYRFFEGEVQFPFGYGLSYSSFEYENASIHHSAINPVQDLTLTLTITNTSAVDGEEVVQVYVRRPGSVQRNPIKTLIGFNRILIPAGQSINAEIPLDIDFALSWNTAKHRYELPPGDYEFQVGASSDDIREKLSFKI